MINLQAILLRFCEPFMDANFTKVSSISVFHSTKPTLPLQIDRIDPLYFARSSRIDLKEETRINATSNEAEEWKQQHANDGGQ